MVYRDVFNLGQSSVVSTTEIMAATAKIFAQTLLQSQPSTESANQTAELLEQVMERILMESSLPLSEQQIQSVRSHCQDMIDRLRSLT